MVSESGSASDSVSEEKRRTRRLLFSRIRDLDETAKNRASAAICRHLSGRPEFRDAGVAAAFAALPSEPDLELLIWKGSEDRRRWCLPRIDENGCLEMREVHRPEDLETGDFNFRAPDPESCPPISIGELDLILIPGVGFDPESGVRLGRGKGHYDRFLSELSSLTDPPPIWGVCFSVQYYAGLAAESHDQPVDAVLTEEGILFR